MSVIHTKTKMEIFTSSIIVNKILPDFIKQKPRSAHPKNSEKEAEQQYYL